MAGDLENMYDALPHRFACKLLSDGHRLDEPSGAVMHLLDGSAKVYRVDFHSLSSRNSVSKSYVI